MLISAEMKADVFCVCVFVFLWGACGGGAGEVMAGREQRGSRLVWERLKSAEV
jgi:hypothetical protein